MEYATYSCVKLRIADKNRRRVELSSSVLLQTLGTLVQVASRYRPYSSICDLFIRMDLNFNFEFKVLTDRDKRSEK